MHYQNRRNFIFAAFLLLCSYIVIFIITLYPYQFEIHKIQIRELFFPGWGESGIFDVTRNIILFAPLGLIAAWLFRVLKISIRRMYLYVFLLAFATSYFIEVVQLTLQSRYPSFIDVISNSLGAVLGSFGFHVLFGDVLMSLSDFTKNRHRKAMFTAAAVLIINVVTLSWMTGILTSFMNWNDSFPLLVGNEQTANRPW
ncbi:hypothetical protein GF337_08710, partial [candidate division KSB1 bacterium]|nr:hypothetical protein [candidate division KSB1 bacterium]